MTLRSQRGAAKSPVLVIVVVVLVVLWLLFKACTVVIGAGDRGVVYSKSTGVRPGSLDEGIHFVVPLIWEVQRYSVRSQTYTMGQPGLDKGSDIPSGEPVEGRSEDGQKVTLDISVRYHLSPDEVWELHRDIGEDYHSKIIKPQVRSDARMIISEYPGIDIFSLRRYEMQQKIEKRIKEALAPTYVIIEEVLVRNIYFSPEFQQAIEQKQIAQQDALRMDYVVKKQEKEKEKTITLARAEAEAIKLKGQVLASYPELVQWEYVNNLPEDLDVVVTDANTIINMGDLFDKSE